MVRSAFALSSLPIDEDNTTWQFGLFSLTRDSLTAAKICKDWFWNVFIDWLRFFK